jgi:hypothetical protein
MLASELLKWRCVHIFPVRFMTFPRLLAALCVSAAATAPARGALVSYWNFETPGNLGDDTGTFNNDATSTVGAPAFSSNAKVGSGALSLNGASMFSLGAGSALDYNSAAFADGFSVASWVNIDATSPIGPQPVGSPAPFQRIFSREMAGGAFVGNGWGVGVDLDTVCVQQMLGPTNGRVDRVSTNASLLGAWHHFGFVYRATGGVISAVDFYLDGVLLSSATTGATGLVVPTAADAYAIGALNFPTNSNFQGFRGLMDDLRIYDNELTGAEMAALAVPEAGSASLAGLAGVMLLRRRSRKD